MEALEYQIQLQVLMLHMVVEVVDLLEVEDYFLALSIVLHLLELEVVVGQVEEVQQGLVLPQMVQQDQLTLAVRWIVTGKHQNL